MASQVPFSCLGFDWMFALAMATSFLWYLFWCVMSPVELDISDMVDWYMFVKLGLHDPVEASRILRAVHNWLPLFLFFSILLSRVCTAHRSFLLTVTQLLYVVVLVYNLLLLLFMLVSGWLLVQLFLVALPMVLMLHVAAPLSSIFAPHVLWLPVSVSLGVYSLAWRCLGPSDPRPPHTLSGFFGEFSLKGALKRLTIFLSVPLTLAAITHLVMKHGCLPCTSTPGFIPGVPPPKPVLLAHRGCGFDFPENTMAAFQLASAIPGMEGLETDVWVSQDGVLFLLHDPFLVRTTDVRERCPHMKPRKNASLLYYDNGSCPISSLNAGLKFVHRVGPGLSQKERELFSSQKIPTFRNFLEMAARRKTTILFDLSEPPPSHPYHHSYVNLTLNEIKAAGMPLDKVYWLPTQGREWVHATYPDLHLTAKSKEMTYKEIIREHITVINDDWTTPLSLFRRYQDANISIIMYFVNSPFMFNYAWCVGVARVTTDNCQGLADMPANTLHQVCSHWWERGENPLIKGGFGLAMVECLLLILWEVAKVTGYWNHCFTRRRS